MTYNLDVYSGKHRVSSSTYRREGFRTSDSHADTADLVVPRISAKSLCRYPCCSRISRTRRANDSTIKLHAGILY